jgi:polyisoprenyl-phosphate glycosyltransferase
MSIENNKEVTNIDISVVIPVYGCDKYLVEISDRLVATLSTITEKYEIIFIDDRSSDKSWELIEVLAKTNSSILGIRLSRNFGQHPAIFAGLEFSSGDWVVVMDCDLQDDPEEIPKLYNEVCGKADIAFAQRIDRQDAFFKKIISKSFYKVLGYLTETKLDYSVANFGIYRRNVIDSILSMKEANKFFPVMARWVGFESISVPVSHGRREKDESSYSLKKLIDLSINIILSFSSKPLLLIVKGGFFISIVSAILAIYLLINALIYDAEVPGWSSVMVSLWFASGILSCIVGVVGLYVGRIFNEAKGRPVYIVKEITDNKI